MKTLTAILITVATILPFAALRADETATAEQPVIKHQTNCPAMGGPINPHLFVEADGKRIYACCPGCLEKVEGNPQEYIEKLETEGVTLEKIQTTCPVMGGKINPALYVDVEGQRIFVCCAGCVTAVKNDPEKYLLKLKEQGVTPQPVPPPQAAEEAAEQENHESHNH
jgi:YHS domain-containing protein